ncbi:MAG: imidazole glycerol phosphate synthase subunit HisH [Clostridiales bacterium]|nr:imidazole glycerol phosphate synthase subunit HisH [Clostridiales bacterium]
MIAIVDYGVGNLFSLKSSLSAIGADVTVTGDADSISCADKIILPGVGAFGDAAEKLRVTGLADVLKTAAAKGVPILGICLGMQLLLEKSFEYGEHEGLGLIHGEIRPISEAIPSELKIPQIGWNSLNFTGERSPIFKYINDGDFVYFVHSFHGTNCDANTIAVTEYGAELTAAVACDNVFGCQFHPEKSGEVGLNILRAFCEL